MITRIEVSGFKTFTDFAVDLAPFTLIAGANASGKSNFFDVLGLLHSLTKPVPVLSWVMDERRFRDSFTKYANGKEAEQIELAVEFLLPPTILDRRIIIPVEYIRLRYEVVLGKREEDGSTIVIVAKERLQPIPTVDDMWLRDHLSKEEREALKFDPILEWHKLPDLNTYDGDGEQFQTGVVDNQLTQLSQATAKTNQHLYTVKQAMEWLRPLHLNRVTDFSNFDGFTKAAPSMVLTRLLRADKLGTLPLVSERLRRVIPEIKEVEVYVDELERGTVLVRDNLDRTFYTSSLSEGTLRVLSLAALLPEPHLHYIFYMEEPENGVDPRVLEELLMLLLDLTTDFGEDRLDLRQFICTTHSPTLLKQALDRKAERGHISVLLATKVMALTEIDGQRHKLPATRMNQVVIHADGTVPKGRLERYTFHQALDYLNRLRLPQEYGTIVPDA